MLFDFSYFFAENIDFPGLSDAFCFLEYYTREDHSFSFQNNRPNNKDFIPMFYWCEECLNYMYLTNNEREFIANALF